MRACEVDIKASAFKFLWLFLDNKIPFMAVLQITSFVAFEEAPPIIFIALGLDNGCIYCIQGDIARERIKRFKLEVDSGQSGKIHSAITGLGFRVDGQAFQLFAVTPSSVSLFNLQSQTPIGQTLDHIGSETASVALSDRLVGHSLYLCLIHYCLYIH